MENQVNLQQNKIFHLEDSMVMYGIHNSGTLKKFIDTVHKMHNKKKLGMKNCLQVNSMIGINGI